MEKAADWLNHEIRNWVRWCYSGPYPGPLPPTHCTSLEGGYVSEAYWGSEPDDRPPPIFVEHALIVQRVFDSLSTSTSMTPSAGARTGLPQRPGMLVCRFRHMRR